MRLKPTDQAIEAICRVLMDGRNDGVARMSERVFALVANMVLEEAAHDCQEMRLDPDQVPVWTPLQDGYNRALADAAGILRARMSP